jgi:hypothetical protein
MFKESGDPRVHEPGGFSYVNVHPFAKCLGCASAAGSRLCRGDQWAQRDIIGERLTMDVTKVVEHYGNFILTANVDGDYDKRGLPNPLVHAFYFTVHGDRVVQLIILRSCNDI